MLGNLRDRIGLAAPTTKLQGERPQHEDDGRRLGKPEIGWASRRRHQQGLGSGHRTILTLGITEFPLEAAMDLGLLAVVVERLGIGLQNLLKPREILPANRARQGRINPLHALAFHTGPPSCERVRSMQVRRALRIRKKTCCIAPSDRSRFRAMSRTVRRSVYRS